MTTTASEKQPPIKQGQEMEARVAALYFRSAEKAGRYVWVAHTYPLVPSLTTPGQSIDANPANRPKSSASSGPLRSMNGSIGAGQRGMLVGVTGVLWRGWPVVWEVVGGLRMV